MDVSETLLPGVGIRYEFHTTHGEQVGLVAHRDGRIDVMQYDTDDPDACSGMMTLTAAEAEMVAELLGAPRVAEKFASLTREIPGLESTPMPLEKDSTYIGHRLGDTRARTLTGASIVAIVRDKDVVASPSPDEILQVGDVLVAIGTDEGLAHLKRILQTTTSA